MNKKLIKAEDDMIAVFELSSIRAGFTMKQIIEKLSLLGNQEAEIRAAFWTLMNEGVLEYGNKPNSVRLKNKL